MSDAHEFTQRVRVVSIDPDGNQLETPMVPLPHHTFKTIAFSTVALGSSLSISVLAGDAAGWGANKSFYPIVYTLFIEHSARLFTLDHDSIVVFAALGAITPLQLLINEVIKAKDIRMFNDSGTFTINQAFRYDNSLMHKIPSDARITGGVDLLGESGAISADYIELDIGGYLLDD